jgi:hypothetical protein
MTLMKRVLAIFGGLTVSLALAQAGFVAQPYGDQVINADQSITLPQGGVIRDNKRGFSIDAKFIQYKDNEFLKATDAKIKNNTGQSINAKSVDYTIKNDRMNIVGPLSYADENVSGLNAQRAVAFPDSKRILAFNVNASSPRLKANAAVFDSARQEAFLYGNYEFKSKDGKTTGTGARADSSVVISFKTKDKPVLISSQRVAPDVLKGYLALIESNR